MLFDREYNLNISKFNELFNTTIESKEFIKKERKDKNFIKQVKQSDPYKFLDKLRDNILLKRDEIMFENRFFENKKSFNKLKMIDSLNKLISLNKQDLVSKYDLLFLKNIINNSNVDKKSDEISYYRQQSLLELINKLI